MNVTLKIAADLCKKARHRAVDEGLSLSGWVMMLIKRELASEAESKPLSLLEMIGSKKLAKSDQDDFEFTREKTSLRDIDLD